MFEPDSIDYDFFFFHQKQHFFNSLLLHAHIHIMHEHFYFNPHNLLKAVVDKIQIGCSAWVGHQCLNVWESTYLERERWIRAFLLVWTDDDAAINVPLLTTYLVSVIR